MMQGTLMALTAARGRRLRLRRNSARPPGSAAFATGRRLGKLNIGNVVPGFINGTNVLEIKYKSADPNQAALLANTFLAATIDAAISMKAASGDQTARWFEPQLDNYRKDLQSARIALEQYQAKMNVISPKLAPTPKARRLPPSPPT